MRVLNIIPNTNLAGTEQASLRFMTGLQKHGYVFSVLSLTSAGPMKEIFEQHGIATDALEYKGKGGWKSYAPLKKKLSELIDTFKPDIIIQTSHHLLTTLILSSYKIPKILAVHHHHQGVKPAWQWKIIYKICNSRFAAITFPSDFIRDEAMSLAPFIAEKSYTVRNPLPTKEPITKERKQHARAALGIPQDALVIGNSSQLIKRKRLDVFLDVAKKISTQHANVHFLVAGDGEERQQLEKLAQDLGVAGRITWLGWQRDLAPFYHSLDFMLFNSDWDAFPTTPLEAMAYGVPVVASAVNSGLKEVISNGKYGYLILNHDTDKLAGYLLDAFKGKVPNTGLAGREHVQEMCHFDHCVEQLKKVIEGSANLQAVP